MEGLSAFLSSYFSWFPVIFLAAGIGLAVLAVILFLRFHLASVIKAWMFHHGFWKKKEPQNRTVAESEEYQHEISQFFATSGTDSNKLKKKAREQKKTKEREGTRETATQRPDPDGAEETTLLEKDLAAQRQDYDSGGPGTAPLTRNGNTAMKEGRGTASNTGPAPGPWPVSDPDRSEAAAPPAGPEISDGSEPTTLLEKTDSFGKERPAAAPAQPGPPGGEGPAPVLTRPEGSDGEEPTALLIKPELSDGEETTELLTEAAREGHPKETRPKEKAPSGDIPDFKITKKEIFIHTDEKI